MAEAPDWMNCLETAEWIAAECDECGQDNEGCECIACTECLEFGPGALTEDQDLALCEDCAESAGVALININDALRRIIS